MASMKISSATITTTTCCHIASLASSSRLSHNSAAPAALKLPSHQELRCYGVACRAGLMQARLGRTGGAGVLERPGLDQSQPSQEPSVEEGGEMGKLRQRRIYGGGDRYRVLLLDHERHTEAQGGEMKRKFITGIKESKMVKSYTRFNPKMQNGVFQDGNYIRFGEEDLYQLDVHWGDIFSGPYDEESSTESKVDNGSGMENESEADTVRRISPVKMETDEVHVQEPSFSNTKSSSFLKGVAKIGDMTIIDIDGLIRIRFGKFLNSSPTLHMKEFNTNC